MPKKRLPLDGTKVAWHLDRVHAWQEGLRIAPVTVDMALTQVCTFKCQFCYGNLQKNGGKALSEVEIERTLRDMAAIGVRGVSFVSDGESTCNPYWKEAIELAHGLKMAVALGTNGFLYEPSPKTQACLTYLRFNISAARADKYCQVHGVDELAYERVLENIREAVRLKRVCGHRTTIGLQMVLLPQYIDQAFALGYMGKGLGVDYTIIKHCSDDEKGTLGIQYAEYDLLHEALARAEKISDDEYQVAVKWSKIRAGNARSYRQCHGPQFLLQISGSGVVAPCGMFFNQKYFRYHIGNLHDASFKDIWASDKYGEVMRHLGSDAFNAQKACGCLCIQDATNIYLDRVARGEVIPTVPTEPKPEHIAFV